MAKRYELSLAPDYCATWGIVEAVRELFQNAIDQALTPGHDMAMFYNEDDQELTIRNDNTTLNIKTLLLGSTSKLDDKKTIGKFGEGYKIASLVLCRLGKVVHIFNFGAKTVWHPHFIKSKKYGGIQMLVFDVEPLDTTARTDLEIIIAGISPEEYQDIYRRSLFMHESSNIKETSHGSILYDEKYKGQLYVSGLYICEAENLAYGYNFKPEYVTLDRDRTLIRSFDIEWESSYMHGEVRSNAKDVVKLLKEEARDVTYVVDRATPELITEAYNDFVDQYGYHAVPVSTQSEAQAVRDISDDYRPVIVASKLKDLIKKDTRYDEPKVPEFHEPTLADRLDEWARRAESYLPPELQEELSSLIDEARKYD